MAREMKEVTPEKVSEKVFCLGIDCAIREDCQRYKVRRQNCVFSKSLCWNYPNYPYHIPAEE